VEKDCNDLEGSGLTNIDIDGFGQKEVYCDNGWVVVMRRYNSTMSFHRNWNAYKVGFGDPREQFWIGNDALYALTNQGDYSMQIDMLSCDGNTYYVRWNLFRIQDESQKYKVAAISVDSYNTSSNSYLTENIHWPTIMADVNETVAELKRQQAKGRIRYYGVCNFGPNDLRGFLEAGGQPISNQVCYNLLWRSIEEELLPLCQEKGISLLPYSPLQQGLLTGKFQKPSDVPEGRRRGKLFHKDSTPLSRHGHDGAEKEVFQAISEIREVCANANIPMATASLSWLLQQPCVKSVIVGASNPQQVVENCQRVTLPEDMVQKFSAATDPVKVIFKGDMDQWAYGRSR
ncbi:angiopoietin-1-like, partial [Lingula anatina]|uniref:Angiopoietin-1-like n=1 Tax=Lingula anatina TaxID=7574 RepID=A0A2R2ML78_LINAN